jgi:hypothetical protein
MHLLQINPNQISNIWINSRSYDIFRNNKKPFDILSELTDRQLFQKRKEFKNGLDRILVYYQVPLDESTSNEKI